MGNNLKNNISNIPKSNATEQRIFKRFNYKKGSSVIVKEGVKYPDYGVEIGGWRGRIYDIINSNDSDEQLISIEWDDETKKKMPVALIKACKKDNMDPTVMSLSASEIESLNKDEALLTTMTKEIYMLARINYELFDKQKIQKIFAKLKCMEFDNTQGRWVWLYYAETKKIKFQASYSDLTKDGRPVVLGSFFSKTDTTMYLNVNSFERAKNAIIFFDKHIPRKVAKATDILLLNKVFSGYLNKSLPKHEYYFDKEDVKIKDYKQLFDKLEKITSSIEDTVEKKRVALNFLENISIEPFSEIERLPINFYEEGITNLANNLQMREIIAMEHWSGNKDFSFNDIFNKIVPKAL
ncbi:MAG: hypothetical protein HQK63_07470 [Desulfamplus sp.]|nr:hypothetical protein [Desulfamplus sp.]